MSKAAASNYIAYAGKIRRIPIANLRLYSVYGPLEDTSRLIPNLVAKGLKGAFPPLVDPNTSRDFIYIDDVCDAFIQAAARLTPDIYGEAVNIGTGRGTTIRQLAKLAADVFAIGEEPVFGSMPGRSWDLPDWYAAPGKAERLLNWTAKTDLATGLKLTSEWVRSLEGLDAGAMTKRGASPRRRSISAIIACYKDEPAIPIMHRRLTDTFKKLDVDYEIIFVNDGSPDNCAERILEISATDPHVLGITHSRNFGSQMAFRSGMEMAVMQACVLLDGDLQDPPELIEQFYHQWIDGYDVVYGRRVKRDMPFGWGVLYKAFYRLFAYLSYVKIPLDAGDFSLIDRRVVGWLLRSPERDLFLRGLRARREHKQPPEEPGMGEARHLFLQQCAAENALRCRGRLARTLYRAGRNRGRLTHTDTRYRATRLHNAIARFVVFRRRQSFCGRARWRVHCKNYGRGEGEASSHQVRIDPQWRDQPIAAGRGDVVVNPFGLSIAAAD